MGKGIHASEPLNNHLRMENRSTCLKCQSPINSGAKFCNKCGASIIQENLKEDPAFVSASFAGDPLPVRLAISNVLEKTCPFCAETVKRAAIKCKHCGSSLQNEPQEKKQTKTRNRSKEFRVALANNDIGYAVSQLPFEDQHAYQLEFDRRRRNAGVAYTLCILLGIFGVHKFYIGEQGWGFFYIFLTLGPVIAITTGVASIPFLQVLPFLAVPFMPLLLGPFITSFCCLCDFIGLPGQVERANDRIRQDILYEFSANF